MLLRLGVLVGALSFMLSLALAAPSVTWFDSGELALAAGTLGVAHPPGQPAYLSLAALAALLPVGELSFRLTVFSAFCLALAAALAAVITARLVEPCTSAVPSLSCAGLLAGGLLACSPAAVAQSVRPELYALALLLLLGAVNALLQAGARGPALAALCLAVCGAVHYAVLVAAVPGLLVLAWRAGPASLRRGALAGLLLLVPALGQYLWLPLRSLQGPVLDFAHPQTLERFWWSVSAGPYRRSFEMEDGQLLANLVAHIDLAFAHLGPLALLLAALGSFYLARRDPRMVLAGFLLLVGGVLPSLFQGVFSGANPDLWGYLLLPLAVLACAAGLGAQLVVASAARLRPPLLRALMFGLVCAVLLGPLLSSLERVDASARRAPARLADALLDGAPAGGVVALAGDSWLYPSLYQRYWNGRRADLELVPLLQLDKPIFDALQARGVALDLPSLSGRDALRAVPARVRQEHELRLLARSLRWRPLLVNEVFVPPELEYSKQAEGLLYRLVSGSSSAVAPRMPAAETGLRLEQLLWRQALAPMVAAVDYAEDPTAHRVLARRYLARTAYLGSRGLADAARQTLARGLSLQPDPGALIHLARYRLEQDSSEFLESSAGLAEGAWMNLLGQGDELGALGLLDVSIARSEGSSKRELRAVRGAVHLMTGQLERAAGDASAVLEERPFHSLGNLLRDRLYVLGNRSLQTSPLLGPRTEPNPGGVPGG